MPQLHYRITNGQPTCATSVTELWTQAHEGQTVSMEPLSPDKVRSLDQNSKYHAWNRVIDEDQGQEPGWAHLYNRYYIALPIYMAGVGNADLVESARQMLRGLPQNERLEAADILIPSVTKQFSTAEMSRFMDAVQRYWAAQGVLLD